MRSHTGIVAPAILTDPSHWNGHYGALFGPLFTISEIYEVSKCDNMIQTHWYTPNSQKLCFVTLAFCRERHHHFRSGQASLSEGWEWTGPFSPPLSFSSSSWAKPFFCWTSSLLAVPEHIFEIRLDFSFLWVTRGVVITTPSKTFPLLQIRKANLAFLCHRHCL